MHDTIRPNGARRLSSPLAPLPEGTPAAAPAPDSLYLFGSPDGVIEGHGIAARVTCPARDDAFLTAVNSALAMADTEDAVLIGAIPFDTREPSSLVVPRRSLRRAAATRTPRQERMPGAMRAARTRPEAGQDYRRAVGEAVARIRAGALAKIVLARTCDIDCTTPPDIDALLARLCAQNASGYPFRIPLDGGATLVGASPEQLIAKRGASIASTPLAGSARRTGDHETDARAANALLASAKDQHEHAFVVAHIREVLEPHCRRLDVPETPVVLATPTMLHLASPITGELIDPAQSVLQLACLLHPTPAVGGVPSRLAQDHIAALEGFERAMFAGLVGWCDARGDGEWAVTIRCGTVTGRHVRLYAGAGIVGDSDPEAEWRETEAKLATMKQALGLVEALK